MSDPFVAEIRIFPFNFAPKGWAFCDGQLMSISQNTALFSLLGTVYGGNGQSIFGLPNLQGKAPMQPGQGAGLSMRDLGEQSGVESVTLLVSEIPVHTHSLVASPDPGDNLVPAATFSLAGSSGGFMYHTATDGTGMAPQSLPAAGGSLPHNNMQPYLTLTFCISLQGVFPARQ